MSAIGWIDFSSEHREKVRAVLDLLKVKGVVDELGVGVIRDSLADHMFPGVTTVQTRAKYFPLTALLINRYLNLWKQGRARGTLEAYLDKEERRCRIQLVRNTPNLKNTGIIGSTFGEKENEGVMRRPSSIYWNGLCAFGMIRPRVSLSEYDRRLNQPKASLRALARETSNKQGDDWDAEHFEPFMATHPEYGDEDDYLENLEIHLTRDEAILLREQITSAQPDSLLAKILRSPEATKQVLRLSNPPEFSDFSELPFVKNLEAPELVRTVELARDFWIIFDGAYIRYNCLLQERFGSSERKEEFQGYWEDWHQRIQDFPDTWSTEEMWNRVKAHGSRVRPMTKRFIEGWIAEAQKGATDLEKCNQLVIAQERNNKKRRARLRPGNESESVNGWLGLSGLNYRLTQVKQLVQDIAEGEQRS